VLLRPDKQRGRLGDYYKSGHMAASYDGPALFLVTLFPFTIRAEIMTRWLSSTRDSWPVVTETSSVTSLSTAELKLQDWTSTGWTMTDEFRLIFC